MAEVFTIAAEIREGTGKGSARAIRRTGRIPAVIYGGKQSPESISVPFKELDQQLKTGRLLSTVVELDVAGKTQRTIPRDVQLHPVTDMPLHVDFLRLEKGAKIAVMVRVNFTNEEESPGLKRGGVLNIVRRELELMCPVDAIPDSIEVLLDGLEINDIIHISAVTLPDNVEPTITDRDFTVASITAPTVVREEEADAAAEGEEGVEGEGVEGEDGGAEGEATEGESGENGDS